MNSKISERDPDLDIRDYGIDSRAVEIIKYLFCAEENPEDYQKAQEPKLSSNPDIA